MLGENAAQFPALLLDNLRKATAAYCTHSQTPGRVALKEGSAEIKDEGDDKDEDKSKDEYADGDKGLNGSSNKQEQEWDKVALEFYRLTCAVIADPTILSDEVMTTLACFPISVSVC